MSFDLPVALLALLFVPMAVGAYLFVQHRRPKYAVRFTNLDLLANVVHRSPGWRRHVPPALYVMSIAVLALALARPQVQVKVPREEATVILVTDISGSMNATDIQPTRLGAAQASAEILLNELPAKFRIGLVAFSTGVRTVTPPTTDRNEVRKGLYSLRAEGGTAMGDALLHALEDIRLAQEGDAAQVVPPSRGASPAPTPTATPVDAGKGKVPAVIVLLSDGKQTLGTADPMTAADQAKQRNIPIYTIALGTQNGVVEVPDQTGQLRRLRVPPDEETLKAISSTTDGKSFSAPSAKDLRGIYQDLGSVIGYDHKDKDVTTWFAGVGGLLVLAAGGLSLLWFNRFP